jgi:HAD superfamily hydrolase (TIGR01509 family)
MSLDFAVGFDFDHTLGVDNKLERTVALEQLALLAAANGLSYDTQAADGAIDEVLREVRRGERTVETCIAGFYEMFAPVGGGVVDAAGGYREIVLENAPKYVAALPGALELLAKLDERHVSYALLTNGWSPLQEEKARLIAFRGPVFVSERLGFLKPSAQAFAHLVKYFERPASDIWYVGDDPEADCAGAVAAGMTAVWFDWEERTYPEGIAKPTHSIHTLEELLALLPCG